MGQKTNSNLLRLNLRKNEWKSKFIEKLFEESSLYIYYDLEIRKYINRFFRLYNLSIHNCILQYSSNILNIHISYFISLNTINSLIRIKKSPFLMHKKCDDLITYLKINNFTEILLDGLNLFTKKKINIFIIFQNLNNLKKFFFFKFNRSQISYFKKLLLKLRRFEKNSFFNKTTFKETIILLIISSRKKKSSKLLSKFIAFQIGKMKKHNLFFVFLKQSLLLILKSKFSYISGIKIVISGRFNGAPRSKSRIIQIGIIPLQSFNFDIDYSQSVAYTSNGTFGIKIWICEN